MRTLKYFTFLYILMFCCICKAQNNTISIFFPLNKISDAAITDYSQQTQLAAEESIWEGQQKLIFQVANPGIYRLYYIYAAKGRSLDILYNGAENISLSLKLTDNDAPSFIFYDSDENSRWQDYLTTITSLKIKIDQLRQRAASCTDKAGKPSKIIHRSLAEEEYKLQKAYDKFMTAHKGTLLGLVVQNKPFKAIDLDMSAILQRAATYRNFWNGIDNNSELLLNTPVYSDLISEYITLYTELAKDYREEDFISGFKESVDIVMWKFGKNGKIKHVAGTYLETILGDIKQSNILDYLIHQYKNKQCENDYAIFAEKTVLKAGMPAPDLTDIKLRDISGENIVVAFWAAWCPHCLQEMPKLNRKILNYKDVTVVAISLDTDPELYLAASRSLNNMMHFCDTKKWDGEAANKFNIKATPTFFLLNNDRLIVDEYENIADLLNALKALRKSD